MKRMYETEKSRTKKEINARIEEIEPYTQRPWHEKDSSIPQSYINRCRAEIRILNWVLGQRKRPWFNSEDYLE